MQVTDEPRAPLRAIDVGGLARARAIPASGGPRRPQFIADAGVIHGSERVSPCPPRAATHVTSASGEPGPEDPGALAATGRLRARGFGAAGFALAAAAGVALGWGFSVDDALISARVAHQLATGHGYRFNAAGPVVDAVTPLGWAQLLAPFARDSAWHALQAARVAGALGWVLAAARLGLACAARCRGWRLGALALALGASLPLGAWASAGMETALVMALGVLALGSSRGAALCAGLAAGWRPELIPWALVLVFGLGLARRRSVGARAAEIGLELGPALVVAAVRARVFGHAAPLAVFAKPSDVEHGLRYAFGALLLSGLPWLLLARRGYHALSREHWAVLAALGVHALVLLGVGGDWMPLWRLAMPVMPGVLWVGAVLLGAAPAWQVAGRLAAVLACSALLHATQGRATRAVLGERAQLIAQVAPLLAGAQRVASLDVGWVGAAGDYVVIDLAGVTDPDVAYLPGGHTSKRLPPEFLERRDVDALVLLAEDAPAPDGSAHFSRQVEQRVAGLRGADRFVLAGSIALNPSQSYRVLRRAHDAGASP